MKIDWRELIIASLLIICFAVGLTELLKFSIKAGFWIQLVSLFASIGVFTICNWFIDFLIKLLRRSRK